MMGQLALPPFPVMADLVAPEIEFATDALLLSMAASRTVDGSAPVGWVSQAPCPTTSKIDNRPATIQMITVQVRHVVGRIGEVRGIAAVAPRAPGADVVVAGQPDGQWCQIGPLQGEVHRVVGPEAAAERDQLGAWGVSEWICGTTWWVSQRV